MKKILFLIIVGVGVTLAAKSVFADTLTFYLDEEFSGATEPEASQPPSWLSATFVDIGLNLVRLTMEATGLTDREYVSGWYYNWDLDLDEVFPYFDFKVSESSIPLASATASENFYKADGDLGEGFDILVTFPTAEGSRYETGDVAVFEIGLFEEPGEELGPTLFASSFDFKNEAGNFFSAAHVQGIGVNNNQSGWIGARTSSSAIPEPATILLLGTGLASLLGIRRFKSKK